MTQKQVNESSILSSVSKSQVLQSLNIDFDADHGSTTSSSASKDFFARFVFPIAAEANRVKRVPHLIRLIEYFYIFLQILMSGFGDIIFRKENQDYFRFLQAIYFGFVGPADDTIPFFIALVIIDFITLLFAISILVDYQLNHEYRRWMIIVLRFWHGHLFGIFLVPNVLMMFNALEYLGVHNDPLGYVILVVSAIFGGYAIWHCLVLLGFFSRSPYLTPSPVHAWNIQDVYLMILIYSIPLGLEKFLNDEFDWYFELIPLIILIAINALAICFVTYFPFKGTVFNAISFMPIGTSIVSCILNFVETCVDTYTFPDLVYYLVPIGVGLILAIVMGIVLKSYRNKIVKSLMYSSFCEEGIRPNDEHKRDQISTLNVKTSRRRVMLVQIGFEELCDLVTDWSLLRYMSENFPTDDNLLVFLCWIVSLFPSEIHFLHNLLSIEGKVANRGLNQKCLIFQVHRIHIFRQSSASKEASNDFSRVNSLTTNAINSYCKFWHTVSNPNMEFDEEIYTQLAVMRHQADAAWSEALDKYPNNSRFQNEYSRYLLDCCCSFKKSILIHQHALDLESGAKLVNDRTFHYFVLTFPLYLKKGIVDTKGTLKGPRIITNNASQSSTTVTSTQNSSNVSSQSDLSNNDDSSEHIDMQEGSRYLPQASLRLALERAIGELKFPIIRKIEIAAIARLILTLVFIIIVIVVLIPSFDQHENLFNIFESINNVMENISLLSIQVPWFYYEGVKDGNVNYTHIINELGEQLNTIQSNVNFSAPIKNAIVKFSNGALESMNDLSTLLYEIDFSQASSLSTFSLVYLETANPTYICTKSMGVSRPFLNNETITYDYLIRTLITEARLLSMEDYDSRKEWGETSDDFCEFYFNQILVSEAIKVISETVSDAISKVLRDLNITETEDEIDTLGQTCDIFIAIAPFFLILFIVPSVIYLSAGLDDDMSGFSKVLRSIPRNDCLKASEHIIKDQNLTKKEKVSHQNFSTEASSMINFPVWLFNIISAVIIVILTIILAVFTKSIQTNLNEYNELYCLFAIKRSLLFDACRELTFIHILYELNESYFNQYYDYKDNQQRLDNILNEHSRISREINVKTDIMPSAVTMDSKMNSIRFRVRCSNPIDSDRAPNYYECLPLDRTVSFFVQMVNSIHASETIKPLLESECAMLAHLLDTRVSLGYNELQTRIAEMFRSKIQTFNILIIVVCVVSIVFVLFSFSIELWMLRSVHAKIDTFKSLILRINPIAFVANPSLLSLVYGKSQIDDNKIISASHAVFKTSHDAMISLNDEGIIESINPAATSIFGYTPEQMLGQNIKILINPEIEVNNQLFYSMQLMHSGQSSLTYEADVIGKKDDDSTVPLKVTLLGFSSNDKMAESFGLMCKDQTLEVQQKTAVEEAKKQSEKLLLQILPKDIIMRLNRGDTDISFTVPSATIIFIDIEKFSNYSASLSASEIMQNLGMVFTAYDNFLHKYDLLIKIKLIGDDYMAAAGLFNPDSAPKDHATQVVSFALECLDAIEELNEHLNASLQVRIGVNTNGPLIAGVLGTDKPLFDIIGDPINVAARLQSTDIPGLVQISQATYDQICSESKFRIEQRGEVELKGKGKQMTYLVHPLDRGINEDVFSIDNSAIENNPSLPIIGADE